jgi:hypothetical protein
LARRCKRLTRAAARRCHGAALDEARPDSRRTAQCDVGGLGFFYHAPVSSLSFHVVRSALRLISFGNAVELIVAVVALNQSESGFEHCGAFGEVPQDEWEIRADETRPATTGPDLSAGQRPVQPPPRPRHEFLRVSGCSRWICPVVDSTADTPQFRILLLRDDVPDDGRSSELILAHAGYDYSYHPRCLCVSNQPNPVTVKRGVRR